MESLFRIPLLCVFLIVCVRLTIHGTLTGPLSGAVEEHCEGEKFHIQCGTDEVILLHEAMFGRLAVGKCVKEDLGRLGCHVDVLAIMDGLCSGRVSCEGTVHSGLFPQRPPCGTELKSYLTSKQGCVRVLDVSSACQSPEHAVHLRNSNVYLLGKDVAALSCLRSSSSRSIRIHAAPGQQIKTGLIDFRENSGESWNTCVRYGAMIESKTRQETAICGGQGRERELMMSNSNDIELRVNDVENPHYMIKFEVIGCPDLASPKFGSVSRDGDESTIGCDHSKQTWHLHCVDNIWVGVVGNCSSAGLTQKKAVPGDEETSPFLPNDVMMTLVVAGSVVLCLATVTAGIVCWKRKSLQSQINKMKLPPKLPKGSGTRPDSEYMMPSYPGGAPRDETEDALYDFCFTPGNAPANPSNVPNNMATAVTLPYRNNLNQSLMYNNTMLPPESGQYKTLIVVRPQ